MNALAGAQAAADAQLGLIADVGGTNVRFALTSLVPGGGCALLSPRRYLTARFPGIVEAASAYLAEVGHRPRYAAFAVASAVRGEEIRITNCPWRFVIDAARHDLQLEQLFAVNDFEALARAIPALQEDEQATLGAQPLPDLGAGGTIAVLGPGTGLGVSAVRLNGVEPIIVSSEGGHASLAPASDEEIEVLRCLRQRYGRVSYERVLSGQGLSNLYAVLCALSDSECGDLTPESITQRARAGGDAMSSRAVELFCEWLGAFAGDVALMFGAWNGIYLAGGLVGALADTLARGSFRERFENKGRLSSAVAEVPSIAVLRPDLGLAGAAATLQYFLRNPPPMRHGGASAPRISPP